MESVLDRLGEEVTGIVSPVSLCMALTVALVRLLNPTGDNAGSSVYIASAYYKEQGDDSTAEKITGSIVNAAIFVGVIASMTFVLVLLFKYGYTKAIYAYMAFAGFSIFFVLVGIIMLQLLVKFQIPLDAFSFSFMLYNFSMVGVTALFFWPAPILMKQGYLVVTGMVTAYMFTFIPEWSTWVMLIAMALYDLCAVLTPHGPLKVLVELAQERDEDIPALVYEARSTGQPRRLPHNRRQQRQPGRHQTGTTANAHLDDASSAALHQVTIAQTSNDSPERRETDGAEGSPSDDWGRATTGGIIAQGASGEPERSTQLATEAITGLQPLAPLEQEASPEGDAGEGEQSQQPLLTGQESSSFTAAQDHAAADHVDGFVPPLDAASMPEINPSNHQHQHSRPAADRHQQNIEQDGSEGSENYLPDAIKLGLGDFIFYSVLVGRAAMYDMLTALVSYLAVMAGLGTTLLLLAVFRKALPALPISIGLGVMFYLLARLLLEPFVLNLSTQLIFV
ncbi:TPA: hypothetical protein ACH3X3_005479 [Trebouxia sp. C0006]